MKTIFSVFPVIYDVKNGYVRYRRRGSSREQAVMAILCEYRQELLDTDDRPQVWIGLAAGMGAKKELTEECLQEAKAAFRSMLSLHPEFAESIQTGQNRICQIGLIGPEASYRTRRPFDPEWAVGDTFAYQLLGEYPEKYGLNHHFVLLRKIDTVIDADCRLTHQFYLTLCAPDAIPKTTEEMERLGYLPLCSRDGGFEYRAFVQVNSRKKLEQYSIFRVGSFPDAAPPKDEVVPPPPLHGWALYDLIRDPKQSNNLERYACWNYEKYGVLF